MRKSLAAFLAVAVAAIFAQSFVTGEAPQGPTIRTSVDVLAVDVSVVDERGRPVSDLGAADFVVEIDGRPRRVVSAEFVRVDAGQAAVPAEAAEPAAETFYTTNVAPPSGRLIVVAVDQ